eukprot:COSAG03_NODE_18_length_21685_cov_15.938988_12_plen_147_part_00
MGMDGGKFKPGAVQLIISGSVLTLFLVIHVKQFRLGQPEVSGDVYTLARQTLADPKMAAGYCAAVAALGFHLWKGWSSVIFSLKLDSQHSANALIIGQVVVRLCNCPSAPASSASRLWSIRSTCCETKHLRMGSTVVAVLVSVRVM